MNRYLFIALIVAAALVHAEPRVRPAKWAQPVIETALKNFYKVSDGLYRSAQPDDDTFAEIKALGITTVLNLRHFHCIAIPSEEDPNG